MNAALLAAASAAITHASGKNFQATEAVAASGGSIHASYVLIDGERRYFAKFNGLDQRDNFAAEAVGLGLIEATGTLRVPGVICRGETPDSAFLVLDYLALEPGDGTRLARLGHALAALHRVRSPAPTCGFGLDRDNYIGATPQPNGWRADWVDFLRERRLQFQLGLAAANGHRGELQKSGGRLLEKMGRLFDGYLPQPSLLHGDLWPGNAAWLAGGAPVVFDPAAYFGDREAELAMAELFGGFGMQFYAAYNESWPLDPGYSVRRRLYQLYHLLNHLNLFGQGYLGEVQRTIAELNAELS
jgi:protein-ribulosamine 3-kinase